MRRLRIDPLPVELTRTRDAAARLAAALGVLHEKITRGHEREAQEAAWRRVREAEAAYLRAGARAVQAAQRAGLEDLA